jgi:hypothetical protein
MPHFSSCLSASRACMWMYRSVPIGCHKTYEKVMSVGKLCRGTEAWKLILIDWLPFKIQPRFDQLLQTSRSIARGVMYSATG